MIRQTLHTPEGTADVLQNETLTRLDLYDTFRHIFRGFGYAEVIPPTFEYYDVFAAKQGLLSQENMLKFFDREGSILVLRPDLTMPLARMTATKLTGEVQKLCYIGNVFRNQKRNIQTIESVQAGIELIGVGTAEADAEVIAVTIQSLLASGLQDFQIEIGQVDIFKDLMKQTGLQEEVCEQIRVFIDQKNILGVQELLENYTISPDLANIILQMPSLFGGEEVLQQAEKLPLSPRAKAAISNLREVYDMLEEYHDYVSVDLAMVQSIDYYTGIIFKGFARGLGFEVCTGGRYDTLLERFGKCKPATGVAISLDLLTAALFRQGQGKKSFVVDALVCGDYYERKAARRLGAVLRQQDLIVENYLQPFDLEKAKQYAKERGIEKLYVCQSGGTVLILDQKKNTTEQAMLADLLEGGAQ